jgi:hypothetical protein
MATESPLLHDGGQNTLSTAADFRNSAVTGSTLSGPSGSGQFLAVVMSTTADRTINGPSTVAGTRIYGICQNKPRGGDAIDVGIFGISKAVAGASITRGSEVMTSSTASGTLIAFSTAAGQVPCGRAIESAVVGQVFSMALYGFGAGSPGGV